MSLSWCGHLSGEEVSQADPERGLWGSQVSHLPEGLKGTLITLTLSQEHQTSAAVSPILHPRGQGKGRSS